MNRKGGSIFLSILTAFALLIAGFVFLNPMKEIITTERAADSLNCSSIAISDGIKFVCLGIDLIVPVLILLIVGTAFGVIMSRR